MNKLIDLVFAAVNVVFWHESDIKSINGRAAYTSSSSMDELTQCCEAIVVDLSRTTSALNSVDTLSHHEVYLASIASREVSNSQGAMKLMMVIRAAQSVVSARFGDVIVELDGESTKMAMIDKSTLSVLESKLTNLFNLPLLDLYPKVGFEDFVTPVICGMFSPAALSEAS